jgi:hypothetical protein
MIEACPFVLDSDEILEIEIASLEGVWNVPEEFLEDLRKLVINIMVGSIARTHTIDRNTWKKGLFLKIICEIFCNKKREKE